ncbi:MAG: hypothetical protein KBT03_09685 [Bacteroidales bacterium]|nr:hypothetical protein [Candidatus Scybalousia scybalohippi]
MKKKYITLEEVLALRGTDTKIYIENITGVYLMFVGGVLCGYNDKNELRTLNISAFRDDNHYILEPEEFKVEKETAEDKLRKIKEILNG